MSLRAAAILLIAAACTGCRDKSTPTTAGLVQGKLSTATEPTPPRDEGPAIDVGNGSKMFDVFLQTPIKAEKEYVGKRIRILGLARVYKDDKGWYVTLPTALGLGADSEGYVARIEKGQEDAFADVKAGQAIVIEATITRWHRDNPDLYKGILIEMERARFIRFHKDK